MNKLSMKKKLNSKSQSFKPFPEEINKVNQLTQNEINFNKAFKNNFPRLQFYNSIENIKQKFDSMKYINQNFEIKHPEKAFFYNILTNSLEDMHKAIKYGIWTSSRKVNESLIEVYNKKEKDQQIRIFLFFRIKNQTTCFGVSELISNYIHEQQFNYWLEKIQWKGLFNLQWIYIGNIALPTIPNGDKILSSFEINQKEGLELLQYYQKNSFSYENSVFVFFSQLDLMEDQMITQRAKFSSVIQYFNHYLFFLLICYLINVKVLTHFTYL